MLIMTVPNCTALVVIALCCLACDGSTINTLIFSFNHNSMHFIYLHPCTTIHVQSVNSTWRVNSMTRRIVLVFNILRMGMTGPAGFSPSHVWLATATALPQINARRLQQRLSLIVPLLCPVYLRIPGFPLLRTHQTSVEQAPIAVCG